MNEKRTGRRFPSMKIKERLGLVIKWISSNRKMVIIFISSMALGAGYWLRPADQRLIQEKIESVHFLQENANGASAGGYGLSSPISTKTRVENFIIPGIIISMFAVGQFVVIRHTKRKLDGIRASAYSKEIKKAKLDNMDIHFDLPLYLGLLGSISSFMIILTMKSGGQMLAYTSTLIGIIASALMRIVLLCPYKDELLLESVSVSTENK